MASSRTLLDPAANATMRILSSRPVPRQDSSAATLTAAKPFLFSLSIFITTVPKSIRTLIELSPALRNARVKSREPRAAGTNGPESRFQFDITPTQHGRKEGGGGGGEGIRALHATRLYISHR